MIQDVICSKMLTDLVTKVDTEVSNPLTHGAVLKYIRDFYHAYIVVTPMQYSTSFRVIGYDKDGKLIIDYTDSLSGTYDKAMDNALINFLKII